MKIALFSDVHANLPALEACLLSIENHKPDFIFCLGDLVGYNIWPNEVVNEIRGRAIPVIKGNYDEGIGLNSDECGCAYKTDRDKEMGKVSISYTNQLIGHDERKYLRMLPAHIRLEYKLAKEDFTLLLVHGSPRKINEYLFEDRDEKSMLRIMEQADADIMCFGHTHKPFHKAIPYETGKETKFRHAVNLGSVGKPKDGDNRGSYVLISMNENTTFKSPEGIQVEFVRFEYDVERAAQAIENSPLPNEYADMLRRGY